MDTVLEKAFGSNKVMNIAVKSVSIKEHKIHASGVARILADVPSTKQLHSLAQLMNYPPPSTITYNHTRVSSTTSSSSTSSSSSINSASSSGSSRSDVNIESSSSSVDKLTTSEQAELISMDFEVCSGMGIKHNGQTVYLKDILVTLNPDTLLSTVMPITMTSPIEIDIGKYNLCHCLLLMILLITIDTMDGTMNLYITIPDQYYYYYYYYNYYNYLGENSQIQSLVIAKKNIWVRAASHVSTVQPFTVATTARSSSRRRSTSFHYDLSALLTSVLTLRGGIVTHQLSWLTLWLNNKRQLVLRNNIE